MKPVAVIRHVPHEGAGLLGEILTKAGLTVDTYDMYRSPPVELPPEDLAGLVVMGGPMNVDDVELYPWLVPERVWIGQAIEAGLPVIGICLGCQLVARALGSNVRRAPRKEIGWLPIEMTRAATEDPLLSAASSIETVFHWHGDTYDLPEGAIRLAGSEVCPQQAFRWGERAWGFQFHIEITDQIIDDWLANPGMAVELSNTEYASPEQIRSDTPQYLPHQRELAAAVLGPFAEMCRAAAEGHKQPDE